MAKGYYAEKVKGMIVEMDRLKERIAELEAEITRIKARALSDDDAAEIANIIDERIGFSEAKAREAGEVIIEYADDPASDAFKMAVAENRLAKRKAEKDRALRDRLIGENTYGENIEEDEKSEANDHGTECNKPEEETEEFIF